jgi:hypothetical protein
MRAVAVPMWSRTRKGTKLFELSWTGMWSSGGTTTAWPREETGKSSVDPCKTP